MNKAHAIFVFVCITSTIGLFGMKKIQKKSKVSRGERVFYKFLMAVKQKEKDIVIKNLSKNVLNTGLTEACIGNEWIKEMLQKDDYISKILNVLGSKLLGLDTLIKNFVENAKENKEKMVKNISGSLMKTIKKYEGKKVEKTDNKNDVDIFSKELKIGEKLNAEQAKDVLALAAFLVKENREGSVAFIKIIRPKYSWIKNPIYSSLTSDLLLKQVVNLVGKLNNRIEKDIERDITESIEIKFDIGEKLENTKK